MAKAPFHILLVNTDSNIFSQLAYSQMWVPTDCLLDTTNDIWISCLHSWDSTRLVTHVLAYITRRKLAETSLGLTFGIWKRRLLSWQPKQSQYLWYCASCRWVMFCNQNTHYFEVLLCYYHNLRGKFKLVCSYTTHCGKYQHFSTSWPRGRSDTLYRNVDNKQSNVALQSTCTKISSTVQRKHKTLHVKEIIIPSRRKKIYFSLKLNVLLTVHHSISVQWNQRDALFVHFIKGLYMFRALLTYHARNTPSAVCASPPDNEQESFEACKGP
jgi:hypothetical protein